MRDSPRAYASPPFEIAVTVARNLLLLTQLLVPERLKEASENLTDSEMRERRAAFAMEKMQGELDTTKEDVIEERREAKTQLSAMRKRVAAVGNTLQIFPNWPSHSFLSVIICIPPSPKASNAVPRIAFI